MTMPDFFTAYRALIASIQDGEIDEGDVTWTEHSDDRSMTLMVAVRRDGTEVDETAATD